MSTSEAGQVIETSQTIEGTQWEQTPKTIPEDDYKSLQAEYTRSNQELINSKIELAKVNPKSILDIKDTKLQSKVIKEIYGLNNINEVKVIYWDNFFEAKNDEDLDEVEKLRKKVALLEYNSEAGKIDQSIKEFKKLNASIFSDKPNAEEKLRETFSLISNSLPVDERLEMAAKIAFWVNYIDKTTQAYIEMQKGNISNWSWGEAKDNKPESSLKLNELRSYFGLTSDKK